MSNVPCLWRIELIHFVASNQNWHFFHKAVTQRHGDEYRKSQRRFLWKRRRKSISTIDPYRHLEVWLTYWIIFRKTHFLLEKKKTFCASYWQGKSGTNLPSHEAFDNSVTFHRGCGFRVTRLSWKHTSTHVLHESTFLITPKKTNNNNNKKTIKVLQKRSKKTFFWSSAS